MYLKGVKYGIIDVEVAMERNIMINKIVNRLNNSEKGKLFIISDFLDIASHDAVRKALSRLVKEEKMLRVLRGIYKKPHYNNFLKMETSISPDYLAQTIARKQNWSIGPKGDASLNILGISTQVPTVYHYVSDGPTKIVEYQKIKIVFEKRSNREISGYSYKTILIIEAIRTLGPKGMNNSVRKIIVKKCSIDDFVKLNIDGKKSLKWIYEEIKKILEVGGFNYAGTSEKVK